MALKEFHREPQHTQSLAQTQEILRGDSPVLARFRCIAGGRFDFVPDILVHLRRDLDLRSRHLGCFRDGVQQETKTRA